MALDFGGFMSTMFQGVQGLTMMSQGLDLAKEGASYSASAHRMSGNLAIQGGQYRADSFKRAGELALSGAAYERQVLEQAQRLNTKGAEYQTEAMIGAGNSAIINARYNKSIDEIQTAQASQMLGRQIKATFSANNAIMARSGVSSASKSYLMTMNDAITNYEEQATNLNTSAFLRQQQIERQGKLLGVDYLNKANQIKYQGILANRELDLEIAASEYKANIANWGFNNQADAAIYEASVDAWRAEGAARHAEYQGEIAEYNVKVQQAQAVGSMIGKLGSMF